MYIYCESIQVNGNVFVFLIQNLLVFVQWSFICDTVLFLVPFLASCLCKLIWDFGPNVWLYVGNTVRNFFLPICKYSDFMSVVFIYLFKCWILMTPVFFWDSYLTKQVWFMLDILWTVWATLGWGKFDCHKNFLCLTATRTCVIIKPFEYM